MKILLSTSNEDKTAELKSLLEPLGHTVYTPKDYGLKVRVETKGITFFQNALVKAQAVSKVVDIPVLGDESGLVVPALNGEPGVYSARYAPGGHDASDKEKYMFLLSKLEGVTDRKAKFVSSICCLLPGGAEIRTEGECPGQILTEPHGEGGFGYDPVFMPDGYNDSMAVLGTELKNRISHRARALAKFKMELRKINVTDK